LRHGHRDRTAAVPYRGADYFNTPTPSSFDPSYPGRSGEVQPCLQAKAKLTLLHVIEYCTSAEQEGGRVGARQVGTPSRTWAPLARPSASVRDSPGTPWSRSGAHPRCAQAGRDHPALPTHPLRPGRVTANQPGGQVSRDKGRRTSDKNSRQSSVKKQRPGIFCPQGVGVAKARRPS